MLQVYGIAQLKAMVVLLIRMQGDSTLNHGAVVELLRKKQGRIAHR